MCEITPELQKLMDEIIKKHGSVETYLEVKKQREKEKDQAFWQGFGADLGF
jgi:hypothetical protein